MVIRPSTSAGAPIFVLAAICVFIQASTEEIESRAFVFGKMHGEGVPPVTAMLVSSFYFAYLHAANPGFGFLPLLSLFVVGIQYAMSYYYFRTIWFSIMSHMTWKQMNDFTFTREAFDDYL